MVLLAISAVICLGGIASALYEIRPGRLVRYPFRRRVPATPDDIRKNGLVLMLNDLGTLAFDFIVISVLLLQEALLDPVLGVSYFAASAAGIAAVFLAMFTAHHLRGEVRYMKRQKAASVPSAQT